MLADEEIAEVLYYREREPRGRWQAFARVPGTVLQNQHNQSASIRLGRRQPDLSPEHLRREIERERYSIRDERWGLHIESVLEGDTEPDNSP